MGTSTVSAQWGGAVEPWRRRHRPSGVRAEYGKCGVTGVPPVLVSVTLTP
ncbi:hypothetical protein [Micromonospora sonneratiae]|uniref:Uncharacterized protein n=1 Tax=Micromonospora sonneratiae TaxID=1184706 RepID=A0ABW3Y5W0_9ACTN